MANKKFSDYVVAGDNITLTYDNNADTVTIDAAGNVDSVNGKVGVVVLNKTDIGLGNVDNTSDVNKPISTATQTALDGKASTTSLNAHISDLNNPHAVTKSQVGLANVDNTSDANKPISTATQTALNSKQDTLVSGTNIKTINSNSLVGSGDVVIDKTSIGLGNVTNVDTTNASNISSGTLSDSRLSANITTQGNTFNAANKLVQLDATAKLPAVDGSQLTNLPSFTPPNGLLKIASAISTTFQAITDYLGNASVLFLNSRRVGIGKDTSVTTQSIAVVEVQDANTSLVLKPNGTGAIIASVPDGTATGGNARGTGAVDLQLNRSVNDKVASGNYSFAVGQSNKITGTNSGAIGYLNTISGARAFASGENNNITANGGVCLGTNNTSAEDGFSAGYQNSASSRATVAMGLTNTASSAFSGVLSGQSNTASTNTHATVVGGQSNTSSGQWSVSGGYLNTSSGSGSIALGYKSIANATGAIVISSNDGSGNPTASAPWALVLGSVSGQATDRYATVLGGYNGQATKYYSYAFGAYSLAYLQNQLAFAPGRLTSTGDIQQSLLTAYNSAALTTGSTLVLSLDGTGTTNLIIPNGNNRAWNVQIDTIAVVTAISGTATGVSVGDCYRETKQLLFKRIGGTSSIVGTVDTSAIKSDTSMSTAALTVTAGASQQMALTFTAPTFAGGGSVTCRVVSKVSLVEVAY